MFLFTQGNFEIEGEINQIKNYHPQIKNSKFIKVLLKPQWLLDQEV